MYAIKIDDFVRVSESGAKYQIKGSFNDNYQIEEFFEVEKTYIDFLKGEAGIALANEYEKWINKETSIWRQFYIDPKTRKISFHEFAVTSRQELLKIIEFSSSLNILNWYITLIKDFQVVPIETSKYHDMDYNEEFHLISEHRNSYFYNRYNSEYFSILESKFTSLISKFSNLEKFIDVKLNHLEYIVCDKQFSYLDKLLGTEKSYKNDIQKRNEIISDENKIIDKINDYIEAANSKILDKIEQILNYTKRKIDEVKKLNKLYSLIIESYQEESGSDEFFKKILQHSYLAFFHPQDYELSFDNSGVLILNYFLPDETFFSKVKDRKYNSRTKGFSEILYTDKQANQKYELTIYSMVFKIIRDFYELDFANKIEVLVFNGWSNSINKQNGQRVSKCILSISITRKQFKELNYDGIDLKESFKYLKGVAAKVLAEKIPIPPIMQINRNDKRFVQSVDVLQAIDSNVNLAAMDWLEFEHLIRELFEKEFSPNGGEVKITQSSRDGGVDAIAFDPDPIRGGKIIIQSKRYTNVVGVSAVRDLYGSVLNEGATKGILVTTSHFGNDAYEFSNGKPLTLIDGSNLLHILERHGYNAKIDINEAKKRL